MGNASSGGWSPNHGTSFFPTHQRDVIPNRPAEGGQERDLTSDRGTDAVGYATRTGAIIAVSIAPVVIHRHRKLPLPPAFSGRVRDDSIEKGNWEILRSGEKAMEHGQCARAP